MYKLDQGFKFYFIYRCVSIFLKERGLYDVGHRYVCKPTEDKGFYYWLNKIK